MRRSRTLLALLLTASLPAQEPGGPDTPTATDSISAAFRERGKRRAAFRNDTTLTAIRRGVGWLVAHQDTDGRWSGAEFAKHDPEKAKCDGAGAGYDIGVTSLALLALLAQDDPANAGACQRAADWLGGRIHDKSGAVGTDAPDWMYEQALLTLAMAEAGAVLGVGRYLKTAASSLGCLERFSHPGRAWRYNKNDADDDTSITSWCLAAYAACVHAGLAVPADSAGSALAWLDSVTDRTDGRTGYSQPGELSARESADHGGRFPVELGEAMTAATLHARFAMCSPVPEPLCTAATDRLLDRPPTWEPKALDFYYWLHGSLALGCRPGSPAQKKWDAAVQKAFVGRQRKDGSYQGSWDPIDAWGHSGGRVYATAAAILSLSASWRLGDPMAALVPDMPPLQSAHAACMEGRLGEAVRELERIAPGAWTDAARAAERRLRWCAAVQDARAVQCLAALDARWPDPVERHDLLEELERALAPLPRAKELEQRRDRLLADPAVRAEVDAMHELRALQKPFAAARSSKNQKQRKQVHDQLAGLLAKVRTPRNVDTVKRMMAQVR